MINFLIQPEILGGSAETAGKLLALYGVGRMSGRFVGSFLMARFHADLLLTISALIAAAMCVVTAMATGPLAAVLALSIGLFTSITFPTVFTLTLERSAAPAAASSGILVMAIVGGAILPPLAGRLADVASLSHAFLLPAAALVVVALFAITATHARRKASVIKL